MQHFTPSVLGSVDAKMAWLKGSQAISYSAETHKLVGSLCGRNFPMIWIDARCMGVLMILCGCDSGKRHNPDR
jgi:hypothetical protein